MRKLKLILIAIIISLLSYSQDVVVNNLKISDLPEYIKVIPLHRPLKGGWQAYVYYGQKNKMGITLLTDTEKNEVLFATEMSVINFFAKNGYKYIDKLNPTPNSKAGYIFEKKKKDND